MRQHQDDDDFYNFLMEDDDDSEHQFCHFLIYLSVLASQYTPRPRCYVRNRIEWEMHVNELLMESPRSFYQLYRMNLEAFNKLCSWIDPVVRVDALMSHVGLEKGPF